MNKFILCPSLLALLLLGGCETTVPECAPGEIKYQGRPPARLFRDHCGCDAACFSQPRASEGCLSDEALARCKPDCGVISPDASGELRGDLEIFDRESRSRSDRALILSDLSSMESDGRALIFEFGFVDVLGAEAPSDWGFLTEGPKTYLNNQRLGSAVFVTRAAVARDLNQDGSYNLDAGACYRVCEVDADCGALGQCSGQICLETNPEPPLDPTEDGPMILRCNSTAECEANQVCLGGGEVEAANSEVLTASPGRLDIESATDERIAGKFFMSFKSDANQVEAEVQGCFNLSVEEAFEGKKIRALAP